MGSKTSGVDNQYLMAAPCTGTTQSTRLTLSTTTATNSQVVSGARYFVRLSSLSSGSAFCTFAATATLPATNAVMATGFWIDPGETVSVKSSSATLAAILTAGTGELLITRQDA